MSYTHPNGQPQGVARTTTNKLREAMIAEVIAINGYKEHIENSNNADINAAWQEIMGDEKKHYGMFLTLLRKYDPIEYKMYQQNKKYMIGPKSPIQFFRPEYDRQIILNNLRKDIKGELEAIILYEHLEESIPQKDIRKTFQAIADEEKEHTEKLTALLLKYDTDKYNDLN